MSDHDRDLPERAAPPDQPEQPDGMREADVANGENPDVADEDLTSESSGQRENDPDT